MQGRPFPNLSGSQMLKLSFRNVCQNFCSCRFPPTPSRHGRFDNSPRRSIGVKGGRRMLRISLRERKAAADDDFFHRSFHTTRLVLGGQLFSTVVSLSLPSVRFICLLDVQNYKHALPTLPGGHMHKNCLSRTRRSDADKTGQQSISISEFNQ